MSLWFIKKGAAIRVLSSFYASSRFRNSSGFVFFVLSSDALSFYICSHSKAEKVKFSL